MTSGSRQRVVRLAVVLPPLFFLTIYGYWQFLGSSACRSLAEVILARTLGAKVTIGGHRISRPSEIELSDLEMEFLADGRPSGVRFRAKRAVAHARRLLGMGPFEDIVLEEPEVRFSGAGASVTKLDLFNRKGGRPGVDRVAFRNMVVAFASGDREYRIGGMDLDLDFSGGGLGISADLGELRIEGVHSARLEEESPRVSFRIEIAESRVVLRDLSVEGRSGWKLEGDIRADLAGEVPKISGELQLRDLRVSTIYTLPPQVKIATRTGESAVVRRTIRFDGTAEDLRYSATTDVVEFIYEDAKLGLRAEGATLKDLRVVKHTNLTELLRALFEKDESPGAEPPDAAR